MRLLGIVGALCVFISSVSAQGPDGFEKFYDAPTQVNMGGRPVVADIALYTDFTSGEPSRLHVALVTDVTEFIEETERDLENWVATRRNECGERWKAGEPYIGFPTGAIRFALDLEYEFWNCGWNGKGTPWRVARETGKIDVTLDPEIVDGKLQASLTTLTIDERTGVNRYLPLEFVTRRVLETELEQLNKNPKFFRAPQPFHDEGFVYQDIRAARINDRVVITAQYSAIGDEETLEKIVVALRNEGIVSER